MLVVKKGGSKMPKKRLTTNGNVFRRTDGRWQSVIWYFDEQGEKKRKTFSSKTKTEAQQKITTYISQFNEEVRNSDESQKTLKDSLTHWLQVFKFPSVERTTYDRLECTAQHQVFPLIGDKIVGDVTAADLKSVLNHWMEQGYAFTTVKKVHILLNEYFRYLTEEGFIQKNPMQSVPMMKRSNFLAAQDRNCVPEQETVTVFTPTEIAKFKREAFSTFANGNRKYQQAAAYILMLNTGLRTGELLGLLNSDIDLERRVLHLERGVKEVWRRDGLQAEPGRDVKVGKLKSATSKRSVPLNDTAIAMIQDLQKEAYFGENAPLVPDEHGNYTRFICIAAKPEVYPGADRTSLLVTLANEPGSLYQVLARIYGYGINLTKLESRPIPGSDDTFRFYFDLEASVYSPELPKLLGELESICEHVCYLGSYSETV